MGSTWSGLNRRRARSTLSHRPLLPYEEIFFAYCGVPTISSSYRGPTPWKDAERSDENVNSPHGCPVRVAEKTLNSTWLSGCSWLTKSA